jgi:hypothetical protein
VGHVCTFGLGDAVVIGGIHEFGLEGYREAIARAIDRHTSHAVTVVFRPD